MKKTLLIMLLAALLCSGCSDDTVTPDGSVVEAGADLPGVEAGVDTGVEAGQPDAGVDGPLPDAAAPDLFFSDGPAPPSYSWCATPEKLTMTGGKVTVTGSTSGGAGQLASVSCGNANGPWAGPQHYYRVALQANKTYRAVLTPAKGFDAALYVFSASTACVASAVDTACAGRSSDVIGAGSAGVEKVTISTTSASDWIVVVDSHSKAALGAFTLTVAEHTPPANSSCAKASEIKLTSGKGSVTGDTSGATNEYGNSIACGGYTYLTGPQLYYKVTLKAKQAYKVSLSPSFSGHVYAFPANGCGSVSSINKACGGSGMLAGPVGAGATGSLVFTSTVGGSHVIAVDSESSQNAGAFTLAVSTFAKAKNGKCAGAAALKLTGGKASVSGDTTSVNNEHSAVKCAGAFPLNGSQLYYKVTLAAGKTYRLALTPSFFGYLHIFPGGSCTKDGKKIEAACGSSGKTGDVVGPVGPGKTGELYFTPAKGGSHVIAVDSHSYSQVGVFSLDVGEFSLKPPATFTAPLSWDFDSACQNLGKTGDWECGAFGGFKADKSCDATSSTSAPKAAHSGSGMWGTVLSGCHTPAVNAKISCGNQNPYDDSLLYFAVTIPGTWKKATLTYWSWDDYLLPFDWSEVRVDGKVVSQNCTGSKASPVTWTKRTVDLSTFAGQTVTVSFHFGASTTVNYSGWYLDDLAVTGQ